MRSWVQDCYAFQAFFAHIVELCQQAGLVWGAELVVDGTNVRANADIDSLVPRWYVAAKAHVDGLFAGDGAPVDPCDADAVPATTPSPDVSAAAALPGATAPSRLPFSGPPAAACELAAANAAVWNLLETGRLEPDRPPSAPHRRITDRKVSTTDADAAPMSQGSEAATLGYHDHDVVNGGQARVILAALVTPADVQDNQVMIDLLDRVRFRSHLPVRRAVADSKYATGEHPRALAERGIQAYMPVVDYDQSSRFFRHQDFTHDAATDSYRCPHGATLTYRCHGSTTRVRVYTAPTATCRACPLRERCTDSKAGRKLNRPFDEDYREQARQLQTTAADRKAPRKRQVWVEPLFGEAKDWHGPRRFRLRGRWQVNREGLLVAAGQNLKRWLTRTGWGRRHGPTGSLALAPPAASPARGAPAP